ncbi:MAG: SDR family oxidoreductase [Acidobacteria bacterium]|nr:SDR family oxidoreductase [Acidobacteriota bacterium]
MKTAIVTGAAGGIGSSICRRLELEGYRVVRIDVAGPDIDLALDITDAFAVDTAIAALDDAPSVVVNNAGIVRFGPLLTMSHADFCSVVDVNLIGTFNVARAAAVRMIADGVAGTIINITSMNGVAPGPNGGSYGATKSAVALLTQQMAIEWGAQGIRVNAIAPGLINAGMGAPIYADPQARAAREGAVPLGRLGSGDDIANVVAFLCSPDASYITGQNLLVDGGVTMSVISRLPRPQSVDSVGTGNTR